MLQNIEDKRKFRTPAVSWFLFIQIIILISALAFGYLYFQEKAKSANQPETYIKSDDVRALVGKLIKIPDDEPTITIIKDIDSLKNQNPAFYKDAQNGYYLLIFSSKAIIYDKEGNIIINVATINSNSK